MRDRERGLVKTETEIGVLKLQAKEHQGLLAAAGSQTRYGTGSPSEPPGGTGPTDTLTLSLQNCERRNFCGLSPRFVTAALGARDEQEDNPGSDT